MKTYRQSQRLETHLREVYGTEPERLWERYPGYAVFRHPASRKWYAIIMDIPESCLGLSGRRIADVINLKCGHVLLGSLLEERGFYPAYHMNKSSWVSVLLDGTVPDEKLFSLLALSYDSVAPKRPRRAPEPSLGSAL